MNPQSVLPALQILLVTQGLNFLAAIFILVIGWLLAGWAEKLTGHALDRIPHLDITLKPLLRRAVRYGILI
ncbi:MAG TPA: hypothetical protein VF410_04130, partial [Rhizomicrobium sp.]